MREMTKIKTKKEETRFKENIEIQQTAKPQKEQEKNRKITVFKEAKRQKKKKKREDRPQKQSNRKK